jgi:hypothetical protein
MIFLDHLFFNHSTFETTTVLVMDTTTDQMIKGLQRQVEELRQLVGK